MQELTYRSTPVVVTNQLRLALRNRRMRERRRFFLSENFHKIFVRLLSASALNRLLGSTVKGTCFKKSLIDAGRWYTAAQQVYLESSQSRYLACSPHFPPFVGFSSSLVIIFRVGPTSMLAKSAN